jgi:hypothetical protein
MLQSKENQDTLVTQNQKGKQDGKGNTERESGSPTTRPRHPHVIPWLDAQAD